MSRALGLTSQAQVKAILNLTSIHVQNYRVPGSKGRLNKIVSEAGIYGLIMQSRKPEAKEFQAWVTGTMLPAIRKDGGYIKRAEKVVTGEMSEDELVLKAMDVMRDQFVDLGQASSKAFGSVFPPAALIAAFSAATPLITSRRSVRL